MNIDLYDHQIKAVKETHNGAVVKGGVGTGKSRVALAYFFLKVCKGGLSINGKGDTRAMEAPRDLYVVTTAKKRDKKEWEAEAVAYGLSARRDLSFSNVQVTVDSWNNIPNYEDIKDAFFVFDEQRLVGNGAWVKAFLKIAKSNQWVVLSATPGDVWMDYAPIFIANGWYKNRTEFIRRHVRYATYTKFPKIEGYLETAELEALRRRVLVEMPYEKHTTRHISQVLVDHNEELFKKIIVDRWHIYEDRPIKDVSELFAVMRKLVNSDNSRLGAVMEALEKHPRLIVFYNFNYELNMLRVLGNTLEIPTSEWNGHKHQEIPDTETWLYLVQYTAGAEGWNCVSTDAMLFWSLNYSYKVREQGMGRIDRLNTPFKDLYYYFLRSSSAIDQAIHKAVVTKKNFNEKDYFKNW